MIKQKLFWYKVFFFINIAVNWTEKVNQVIFYIYKPPRSKE